MDDWPPGSKATDVCNICGTGAPAEKNAVVYCDGRSCNVVVHQGE
jgi:hypothetical protein